MLAFANFLLGIVFGVVASLAAWWILFHLIVPKLDISDVIAKSSSPISPSGFRYRVKIRNSGRRAIIDLELVARLRIKGLDTKQPSNWEVFYPKLSYERIPRLLPTAESKLWPVLTLRITDIDDYAFSLLPSVVSQKIREKTIMLEDLLSLGNKADIQLYMLGYDEYSGARKCFTSKHYTTSEIKTGYFDRHSLQIKACEPDEPAE